MLRQQKHQCMLKKQEACLAGYGFSSGMLRDVRSERVGDLCVAALFRVVDCRLALVAETVETSAMLKQEDDEVFLACRCGLQQWRVAAVLGCIHIGACFDKDAQHVDGMIEGNAGVQGLIAQRIMRELMDMRAVFDQQRYCFGGGECGGEMQRRPSIRRDGASAHRVLGEEPVDAQAIANGGCFEDVEVLQAGQQKVADHWLLCIDCEHESGDSLRITRLRQGGLLLDGFCNFGCLTAADEVEEMLAHGGEYIVALFCFGDYRRGRSSIDHAGLA